MTETTESKFDCWCVVELMGHQRTGGRVTEVTLFGKAMCRIDIPTGPDTFATQIVGGDAIYRLTPTTEELARIAARGGQPEPVHRWELLPAPEPASPVPSTDHRRLFDEEDGRRVYTDDESWDEDEEDR